MHGPFCKNLPPQYIPIFPATPPFLTAAWFAALFGPPNTDLRLLPAPIRRQYLTRFAPICANLRQFMAVFDRFFLMYQRQLKPIFITNTRVKDHISIKQQIRIKFPAPICANYRLRRFAPIRRQSAPIFYGVNFEIILKYRVYFLHFLINYLIVNMRFFADRNIRAFFRNSAPRVAEVIESVTDWIERRFGV